MENSRVFSKLKAVKLIFSNEKKIEVVFPYEEIIFMKV